MAVISCSEKKLPKINYQELRAYLSSRQARDYENYLFDLEGLQEAYADLETELSFAFVLAAGLSIADLERDVNAELSLSDLTGRYAAAEFLMEFDSNLTRLDGSRNGPVGLFGNAFAISDCLAAGRMNNAQILNQQAIRLMDQRAYEDQNSYAEDIERKKDPSNFVEIIPQRLFVFVHELMGQRAGQAKQPWAKWDIVGDKEYIEAARAVYTEDPDLAAVTLCKLCNLHVQYSNPFPEGDNDDHLVGIEFDTPIRSLWPTEIFAWLRLRQERGLPLPDVEHPLLEQPLGHFAPEIVRSWQTEPWFAELVDKLAQFHPRYKDLPSLVFGAG